MSTVTIVEAQQRLGELVKRLPTEGEIVLTDGEKAVAKLTLAERPSIWAIKPHAVGRLLRPYPDPDNDILGEMLEGKRLGDK